MLISFITSYNFNVARLDKYFLMWYGTRNIGKDVGDTGRGDGAVAVAAAAAAALPLLPLPWDEERTPAVYTQAWTHYS